MCNQDNSDTFGANLRSSARSPTGFGANFRGAPRGPAPSRFGANLRGSPRGPAVPAALAAPATGLASVTPSARGPRNRRPRF